MIFEEFELDVTALQQLPETDPIEQDGVQLGGCLVSLNCLVVATKCFCTVLATGGHKKW